MKPANFSRNQRVVLALSLSSLVSVMLFLLRSVHYASFNYWFLNWNLFLAWLPLIFAWWLCGYVQKYSWLNWQALALTILWLGFLPNSFYLSSDLIHLQTPLAGNILYDTVMLLLFSINGYFLGFISLYLIHHQLIKRIKLRYAHTLIALVLLVCSFAIYLGRFLRWNTWDVLTNPAGLLFDVSDRFIHPTSQPETFLTTATFFVLLGSIYIVLWQLVRALRVEKTA